MTDKLREMLRENELYWWCIEQVYARRNGSLSQNKIDALDLIEFPWDHYQQEINRMEWCHYSCYKKALHVNTSPKFSGVCHESCMEEDCELEHSDFNIDMEL